MNITITETRECAAECFVVDYLRPRSNGWPSIVPVGMEHDPHQSIALIDRVGVLAALADGRRVSDVSRMFACSINSVYNIIHDAQAADDRHGGRFPA